jgi:hypothetical protein
MSRDPTILFSLRNMAHTSNIERRDRRIGGKAVGAAPGGNFVGVIRDGSRFAPYKGAQTRLISS